MCYLFGQVGTLFISTKYKYLSKSMRFKYFHLSVAASGVNVFMSFIRSTLMGLGVAGVFGGSLSFIDGWWLNVNRIVFISLHLLFM